MTVRALQGVPTGASRSRSPGLANRSDTFPDLEASARGASAPGATTASVTGLVLRGVKVLTPALTPAAVHLLALLVEHVHGDDRWRLGRLRVVPSNARLWGRLPLKCHAGTVNGLFKAEVIHRHGIWPGVPAGEYAHQHSAG